MAGVPGNRNGARTNRLWGDTLKKAVLYKDAIKLRAIADKVIELAENGDMQAIKEIGDRLDGKSAQQIELTGEGGGAIIMHIQATDSEL